jgi:hypothetical protein
MDFPDIESTKDYFPSGSPLQDSDVKKTKPKTIMIIKLCDVDFIIPW